MVAEGSIFSLSTSRLCSRFCGVSCKSSSIRSAAAVTLSRAASVRACDPARASRASEAARSASRSPITASRSAVSPMAKASAAVLRRSSASIMAVDSSSRLAANSAGAAVAVSSSCSASSLRSNSSALRFSAVSSRKFQPELSLVISWRRRVRASPSRRISSWAERLAIIVIRDASTVVFISSIWPRASSRFPSSATARSASAIWLRARSASSSWRFTAIPRLSSRPSERLRSASARLRARLVSATF